MLYHNKWAIKIQSDLKISDFPNSVCLEVRSIDLSKDGLNLIFGTYGSEIW